MTQPAIFTEGLSKTYGTLRAVDRVDLEVAPGSVFGLLGPNGAGKTTLIKLLTALVPPTEGRAVVAGHDVLREPYAVKAEIGWVAAEVILDDELTAWENLWLQAKLHRLSGWEPRARELLGYFGLADRARSRVSEFSTGMRKKLEIALALLHQPRVIFMDEPTIGLDPGTRRMLWDLIRGIHREFGVTVLLTSHYIEEADALCDQLAIIDHGRIVATGTPAELRSRVSSDLIEVETRDPVDPETLRSLPGVIRVEGTGQSLSLRVTRSEEVLPALLPALGPQKVRRIHVERPSLETVFLDLTGHRIDGDEGGKVDFRKFYATIRRSRQ